MPTHKFAGIMSDSFVVEILSNEEEFGKYGTWVLSRTDPINFSIEWFAQIRFVLREMQGSLSTSF